MRIQIASIGFAALWLSLVPGHAQADKLTMKNGDVISGDISAISSDEVRIKPAYADEFAVNLSEVAAIETDETYDVVLEDGSEAQARFAGPDPEGKQQVEADDRVVAVGAWQIKEAEKPWYERDSRIDVNAVWNGGNTDSSSNLIFADTRIRLGDHRHLGELTFARDETDGVKTKKQDLLRYEYNWLFSDPWYLGATASYERDPIKELDHRYTLGALIGRDIFNDDTKKLSISLGAGYSDEELGGVSDSGAVGIWNLDYTQDLRGGDLAFFHNHNLNYQFYGENNAIFKSNTGFRFDIFEDVYLSTSLRYDYETEPAEGAKSYDTTLAVGVGATF